MKESHAKFRFRSGYWLIGTLANSENPDLMPYEASSRSEKFAKTVTIFRDTSYVIRRYFGRRPLKKQNGYFQTCQLFQYNRIIHQNEKGTNLGGYMLPTGKGDLNHTTCTVRLILKCVGGVAHIL